MSQKNIQLTLSKQDYNRLLDITAIASFILDEADQGNSQLNTPYKTTIQHLLKHATNVGFTHKVTKEKDETLFSDDMLTKVWQQFIHPFTERLFWQELEERLAERDAENVTELAIFATQDDEDKEARFGKAFDEAIQTYMREFIEYRLQRLVIDKNITPKFRYKTETIMGYSVDEIRTIENYCYHTLHLEPFTLMTRAGEEAWAILQKHYPDAKNITILVGPGNNGGDGYILARAAMNAGINVRVISANNTSPATEVAQQAYQQYSDAGGTLHTYDGNLPPCDVIVDALFGIGLDRPITGIYADMIKTANQASTPIVALDCPSGLNADSGQPFTDTIKAAHTYTFIGMKHGLLADAAKPFVGNWSVCSLKLSNEDKTNALKEDD